MTLGWFVLGVIGRTLVLVGLQLAGLAYGAWDARRSNPGEGANIAIGLVVFAVGCLVAFVWGGIDGAREWVFKRILLCWALVGCIAGLTSPIYNQIGYGPPKWGVLVIDVVTVGSFIAIIISVSAVMGGLLGAASRGPEAGGGTSNRI